ncbi:MAG: dUTP diphosphatase [Candidatus Pacebacteria bacterium]|nr:dUTP diphosphatase [Candidatus Paceibacterota bacterium]
MEILIKRLEEKAKLPAYSHEAGPGIDLYALNTVIIEPGAKVRVQTGIAMAMPVGYIGLIWNEQPMVINSSLKVTRGMVDSGYRDEIVVELTNVGAETHTINAGETVAQVLVQQIHLAHLIEAEDLSSGR